MIGSRDKWRLTGASSTSTPSSETIRTGSCRGAIALEFEQRVERFIFVDNPDPESQEPNLEERFLLEDGSVARRCYSCFLVEITFPVD